MSGKMHRRAQVRELTGPSGYDMHQLTRVISKSPHHVYIYRDAPESREIVVSNYPRDGREDQLVGVYDRRVTTASLREDLYGIEEEEYRKTVRVGRRPKATGDE